MALPLRALQVIGDAPKPVSRPVEAKPQAARPSTAASRKEQQRFEQACQAYGCPAPRPTTAAAPPAYPPQRTELRTLLKSFGVAKVREQENKPQSVSSIEELCDDHEGMMAVLSTRQLRTRAARTTLKRGDDFLVEHLTKADDLSLAADVLPFECWRLDRQKSDLSQSACVDMLRITQRLLASAYERYNTVGLQVIDSVLKRWGGELARVGRPSTAEGLLASLSLHSVRESLKETAEVVSSLSCRDGPNAKVAAKIHRAIDKL